MRKYLLVCFAVFVFMTQIPVRGNKIRTSAMKCEINGTLAENNRVDMVFLVKDDNNKPVILDSAKVKDNKFHLSAGLEDAACVRYLALKGVRTDYITVFLDAESLEVVQDEKTYVVKVKGSETNEAYSQMMELLAQQEKKLKAIWETSKDKNLSDEQRTELKKGEEEAYKQRSAIKLKYLQDNIDNIMGLTLLHNMYRTMASLQVDEYLRKIPAAFENNSWYKDLSKYVEIARKTWPGQEYLDLELQTPEGKNKKISECIAQGQYTIIDFWASWCGPCRAEMPNLVKIFKDFGDSGVNIVGISLDTNVDAWKKAIKDLGITWAQLSDLKGWKSKAAEEYGIFSIPQTIIIAPNGRILKKGLRGEDLYKACADWAR